MPTKLINFINLMEIMALCLKILCIHFINSSSIINIVYNIEIIIKKDVFKVNKIQNYNIILVQYASQKTNFTK
jgi:hypothetical protein